MLVTRGERGVRSPTLNGSGFAAGRPLLSSSRVAARDNLERTTVVDGRESGGLLASHAGGFEVVQASGLGPKAVRTEYSIRADPDHDFQLVERWRAEGLESIGCWHCHPGDDGQPSGERGDLSAWAARRRVLELDRYVAIIASEIRGGWTLCVYVVEVGHGGVDQCRPAGALKL
jgi:hypothetical protein